MSKQNDLSDFLTGVADAIRAKTGSSSLINPQDFDSEISELRYPVQLHAVTISLSGDTINISNPSTNGNFVTGYKIYDSGTLIDTISTTSYDLSTLGEGTYTITVVASGTDMLDSDASNSITHTVVPYDAVFDNNTWAQI